MEDWTYTYPDVDPPDTQPTLLLGDRHAMDAGLARAQQAEAARLAELEQTRALDAFGYPGEAGVPLPFATPPSAAVTF